MNRNQKAWALAGAAHRAGVEAVKSVLRELLEAAEDDSRSLKMPPTDAPCHIGIVEQSKCAHCQRVARLILAANAARNVLKEPQ